jgi:hypothetical protein
MEKLASYPVFTSRHSIGLTFLSWSYHWLSDHTHHWHWKLGTCSLPKNPNTGINAHFFKKNYCSGYQDWHKFITDTKNNVDICSMYGGPIAGDNVDNVNKDYAQCLKFASDHVPLIFCVESARDQWYFLQKRGIDPTADVELLTDQIKVFQDHTVNNFIKNYFDDSMQQVGKDVWDLREVMALNFEYLKQDSTYLEHIDRSINHLYVDSKDLWYNGEECLRRIFAYINRPVSEERMPHWRNVYYQWQSAQLKILRFNWYFSDIVDSIVNNYNFDLDFLNLDLLQESVIQGQLIKKHNLNLKCHGLKKFPSNTTDLYLLLEENFHGKTDSRV